MDRFSVYYGGFEAAHTGGMPHKPTDTPRRHGHSFRVVLEAKGPEDPELYAALFAASQELTGETLEEMLPGAATDATGIASWFIERLAMRFPTITRVEVTAEAHHGYVTREPRRSS